MRPPLVSSTSAARTAAVLLRHAGIDPAAVGDFDTRLGLIAKQILQYRHMYRMGRDMVAFARSVRDGGDGGR